ncbi:MAG: energy transducer TonB [Rhodocyclales bacterium GT-UBC]|nr:MAG: energy transducer TonB [Rhodocyclales bacterium GT-UBC]
MGIGISLVFHSTVLAVHFKFPDAANSMREKALDIILVNAKSARKPHDAQALAQANLDGGGNTDENRRAKTPLPPTLHQVAGSELQQMQRRVQELEAAQQKMLTQMRSSRSVASSSSAAEQPAPTPAVSGLDLAESARAMARLEGEINKAAEEYSKRPRKKFIGARTEEYRFAQYIEDWRQKIERIGTLNYPEAARGKLYGSLVLTVAIGADGQVSRIDINRSSGYKLLDDAARRIVQMAGPYSPFPPDIRRDTDMLEITRTWYFTQGDQLSAK